MAYQAPDYAKQENAAGESSELASVVLLPLVVVICVMALLAKCEP